MLRRAATACAVLLASGVAATLSAPAADAAARPLPARPHGAHVAAVSHRSVVVTLPKLPHTTRYRLYVSTSRRNLTVARIGHARRSAAGSRPRLTVGSLPYTTARYYYRLRAYNHSRSRYGTAIGSFRLRPATPSGVRVTTSGRGTWLTWDASGPYQRTQLQQAGNAAMTARLRGYTVRGTTGQFTPSAAERGRTNWFRVRIVTDGVPSAWSAPVHALVRTRLQAVGVLSYNVLTSRADGTVTTGERIAPWSQRRAGVESLIARSNADVVCVQEGGGWATSVQGYGGRRQVDDLADALPGYALARTEIPPSEHHYYRTGNYVLYRAATYRALGAGGYWDLGDTRTAAYQLLQNRHSGARLLAVSAHLNYGAGRGYDDQRARETRVLLARAGALARQTGSTVVFAGDFNSAVNRNHAYDAPATVMRANGIADARLVAQAQRNEAYNSANLYLRTPPRVAQSIDYVWAPPGVAVGTRSLLLELTKGRFRGAIPSDHNPLLVTAAYPY